MNERAIRTLVNGEPNAVVASDDRGLQYGDGLFETIAVEDGKPLLLDAHLTRLHAGAQRLCISGLLSDEQIAGEIVQLCRGMRRAVLKLIVTRGRTGRGYAFGNESAPTRILSLWPWPAHVDGYRQDGVAVRICDTLVTCNPRLAGIKHLNRLEQVLARSEWRDEYQEGLMRNEAGDLIEGTMSNLFLVVEGEVITPDLTASGVAGIMRDKVIECAGALGVTCRIASIPLAILPGAQEVFLTNSVIGLWPVRKAGPTDYRLGPVTRRIYDELAKRGYLARDA